MKPRLFINEFDDEIKECITCKYQSVFCFQFQIESKPKYCLCK